MMVFVFAALCTSIPEKSGICFALAITPFDVESQAELAHQGAYLELTGLNHRSEWGGLSHAVVVEHVRRIGAERFVLASDFGQQASGPPWQGFANEVVKLLQAGLRLDELDIMLCRNPRNLLA
jgi:hypothetical protein